MKRHKLSKKLAGMIVGGAGMPKLPKSKKHGEGYKDGYPAFKPLCVRMGLPEPVHEFKFHPVRNWRADYCWPEQRVLLEVEGAVWTGGGHSRGSGKVNDHEKFSNAAIHGYRILYCQPKELLTVANIERIRAALNFAVDASQPSAENKA